MKRLQMALQISLLLFGLVMLTAAGYMLYNTRTKGVPKIGSLKELELTKAKHAIVTATLKDTGFSLPRDKNNSPSHFYTFELDGKTILVMSLKKVNLIPDSTFYVRLMPYKGDHVDFYFAAVSTAKGITKNELQSAYAGRMLQYFDKNPKAYNLIILYIGLGMLAAGVLWTVLRPFTLGELKEAIFDIE